MNFSNNFSNFEKPRPVVKLILGISNALNNTSLKPLSMPHTLTDFRASAMERGWGEAKRERSLHRLLPCITLLLFLLTLTLPTHAQQTTTFTATLRTANSMIYTAPSLTAQSVTSVLNGSEFEVVGRSLDGTWFEVKRPGRLTNLGWIDQAALDWQFAPEQLPLTDFTTGQTGTETLTADPGYAAYVLQEVMIRNQPLSTAAENFSVPFNVTLPVIERNQDASWLRVNYLGQSGWMSTTFARTTATLATPQARNLPALEGTSFIIVPPEVQLDQIERIRTYMLDSRDLADGLAGLWWSVVQGDVMPCEPPEFVTEYLYSSQDVRELPELSRIVPQADEGITYINESIDALYTCGVVNVDIAVEARNDAINARVVFDAALAALDNVEEIVRARR
jgi:hypothetical protein